MELLEVEQLGMEQLRIEQPEIERLYWFWISRFEEIGVKTIEKLLKNFKSLEGVFRSKEEELAKLDYLTEGMKERL
jgi:ERCC4-type nuclease